MMAMTVQGYDKGVAGVEQSRQTATATRDAVVRAEKEAGWSAAVQRGQVSIQGAERSHRDRRACEEHNFVLTGAARG